MQYYKEQVWINQQWKFSFDAGLSTLLKIYYYKTKKNKRIAILETIDPKINNEDNISENLERKYQ